jgi:hypothetical protein
MTHVWMRHPANPTGYWQCPNEGVADYLALGWELCDSPQESNPAVAERLAFEAELAAKAEAAADKKPARATKSAARSETQED